ncbi:MAG: restriction endonuclease subunit S [Candidatus Hodarchaeales archaeon]|jgi:restriction endonuclease S subunit
MSIESLKSQLPRSWTIKKLQNVCKINPDSLNVNLLEKEDVINYVNIASIDNSSFSISEVKKIGKKEIPSRARRLIKKNDVIVSTVRPYLKGFAKVTEDKKNYVCSTGFVVLRTNENFNSEFLFHCTPQIITQFVHQFYFELYLERMDGSQKKLKHVY